MLKEDSIGRKYIIYSDYRKWALLNNKLKNFNLILKWKTKENKQFQMTIFLKYKHTMKGKNHDHLNKCREKLFKQKFNIHS